MWLGAATLDRGVGVSHYTGAVTHHIAADLDAERAMLATDLEAAGMVTAKYQVTGIGPTFNGRNGGGDLYYTDGEIWVLRLVEACSENTGHASRRSRAPPRPNSRTRSGARSSKRSANKARARALRNCWIASPGSQSAAAMEYSPHLTPHTHDLRAYPQGTGR